MRNERSGGLATASQAIILLAVLSIAPAAQGQVAPGSNVARVPPSSQQPTKCASPANVPANSDCDSMFGTMLEYQKSQAKEKREDRQSRTIQEQISINANAAKLKTDNQTIDKSMQESRERSDILQKPQNSGPAVSPNAVVDVAKPVIEDDNRADTCRMPSDACSEPCKLPPCR